MATGKRKQGTDMPALLCGYLECKDPQLDVTDARVEVKTVMPAAGKKAKCKVKWKKSGDATFHPSCWELLWKAGNSRGTKQVVLSKMEKEMIKEAGETAEHHDSKTTVIAEASRVAEMIKACNHCVTFTGAGISTSAGIGDYRGKSGKWTELDRADTQIDGQDDVEPEPKRSRLDSGDSFNQGDDESDKEEEEEEGVNYEDLRPTYTHEALKKLMELGYLKYVISQNGDGLHGLSGIPLEQMSELHGNVFVEKCEKCGHRYARSGYVMDDEGSQYFEEMDDLGSTSVKKPKHAKKCHLCGLSHRTGRQCEQKGCNGFLMDTIINFRDHLEESILTRAEEESRASDLMLCLGTTLMVTPANSLVKMGKRPLRLVICNRQTTDCDKLCDKVDKKGQKLGSRVFGDCDTFMRYVMKGVLPEQELLEWEGQRLTRMKNYDKQRTHNS